MCVCVCACTSYVLYLISFNTQSVWSQRNKYSASIVLPYFGHYFKPPFVVILNVILRLFLNAFELVHYKRKLFCSSKDKLHIARWRSLHPDRRKQTTLSQTGFQPKRSVRRWLHDSCILASIRAQVECSRAAVAVLHAMRRWWANAKQLRDWLPNWF